MEELGKFFVGPYWAALTGTVTLLSAVIPLVFAFWQRTERQRAIAQSASTPEPNFGCGAVALAGSYNAVAYFLYGILLNGCLLSILGISPKHLRDDYWAVVGGVSSFDSWLAYITSSCGFFCLSLGLIFGLFICSTVAALRYGYEFGVYGLVLGMSCLGFPLNLLVASSIPAYIDLPSSSKVYILATTIASSLLASIAVLTMTWFIARSIYSQSTP